MRFRNLVLSLLFIVLWASSSAAQTEPGQSAIKRGNKKFDSQQYEAAIKEYRQVPEGSDLSYSQALYNIGVCNYELWHTDEAITFYKKAIAVRSGRYPKAWYSLAVALEDEGRTAEASEAYREVLNFRDAVYVAAAHYRLGLLAALAGDDVAATKLFTQAIVSSNDLFPASHNNLGVMLARAGRLNEADQEFQKALEQSDGKLDEATHNHRLCRALINASESAEIASLRLVAAETGRRLLK